MHLNNKRGRIAAICVAKVDATNVRQKGVKLGFVISYNPPICNGIGGGQHGCGDPRYAVAIEILTASGSKYDTWVTIVP